MKNIVLFSDGTGNSAGKFNKTNVWRLYKALDLSETKPDKLPQIAYYDDGVGTSSFKLMALLGGAFGIGLKRNVIDLYTFLCRHYEDQDNIYGFGFSRGAFTIRVLIGLIDDQGLIDSQRAKTETELRRLATRAFRAYRGVRYRKKSPGMKLSRFLRDKVVSAWDRLVGNQSYDKSKNRELPAITFVGLWDTVDAYGMPIDELKDAWDWIFPLTLPNRDPSPKINRICHALALDDERHTFHPVLLNESRLDPNKQEVKQVWFAGVHSNVGGGYPDDAMAMITLDWMVSEIEKEPCTTRIVFKEGEREKIRVAADVGGKLYDSRRGLAGVYRYQPRKIEALIHDQDNQVFFKRAKIHETVFERIKQNAVGYAPIVLPNNYEVVRTQRDVTDESHSTPKGSVVEHPTQAQHRAYIQEKVWNQVWVRRVVYFTSVGVGAWLAAFPLLHNATETCEGAFCGLASVVRGIGLLLPGMVQPWLSAYESHPGKFILLVALFAALLWVGGHIEKRIKDSMRAIWEPIINSPGSEVWPGNPPHYRLYRLRTHPWYQRVCRVLRKWVLPTVAGLLFIVFLLAGLNKGLFAMMSAGGLVCPATASKKLTQGAKQNGQFPSASLCWSTGVEVTQGKRYRITLVIDDKEAWQDGSYPSSINGLESDDLGFVISLGVLLRRYLGEPWFKPMARIGHQGSDEYPLEPVNYLVPNESPLKLVSEITARRSGTLYLFVNDAVLPVSEDWQIFYRNNVGIAKVTVEPVENTALVAITWAPSLAAEDL